MTIRRALRKLRFWQKPKRPDTVALWCLMQDKLYLGPAVSRSEWASIIRVVANEMERQIVEDAGAPIGLWYKENPVDWLKREASRAESRL